MFVKPAGIVKDYLTNCYVREGITPYLKAMEQEYLLNKRPFSVMILDVDHFKSFNDKYGHMYGDEVLKYFSSSLRLDLESEENVPFRFGGDEFVVVFPNKAAEEGNRLAQRLRKNIRTRSCLIKGRQINVTFSGGIASYPDDSNSVEQVMEHADKALYYAKNHGRSRVVKYKDMAQKEFLQMSIIFILLAAIAAYVFFGRDKLVLKSERAVSWLSAQISKIHKFSPLPGPIAPVHPVTTEVPALPTPTPTPEPVPVVTAPEENEVMLQNGRILKGVIKHEDEDVLELELGLSEGHGVIQINKSQVARIRKIPKSTT